MDDGKWDRVKEFTEELGAKQRFLQERGSLRKIGERLYEDVAIHVNPFSRLLLVPRAGGAAAPGSPR